MNNIFEVKNVYFSYLGKFPALQDISINIKQGEKVAIIGANGSGKSTLMQLLDGLISPDKGSIKFQGEELTEKRLNETDFSYNFRKKVGLVFQNPDVQLFCPTVREDILFGPLQLGIEPQVIEKRMEKLTDILDIKKLLDRSPHQLSVGERRKVAIASTLIIDPDVLLLDEPTAGIDPLTTRHIIDLLLRENSAGKTIITSIHDLSIVAEISDIIYVFSQGKTIIKSGTPHDILSDTSLLEDNNLVHIHVHKHAGEIHAHPHEHLDHHH